MSYIHKSHLIVLLVRLYGTIRCLDESRGGREGNLSRKEPKTLYNPILFYTSRSDFPVRIFAFRERLGTFGSSMKSSGS